MRVQFVKARKSQADVTVNPEEILLSAKALFRGEESKDLRGVIAEKIEDLRHYDVLAMDRVVAILMWGRSGSLLVSSYLDGHEDVIMLPELCGWKLCDFFERYRPLPLRDKLIAYPAYLPYITRLFEGDFAISPASYYAAVQAILEFYDKWPPEFLESRRAFFLFVHIAYNLALDRRPASSNPLIVYAQHALDNVVAGQLVEDFPQAKFVHTVRDPISTCNGMFQFVLNTVSEKFPQTYTQAPYSALLCLVDGDRPHLGMESRTRTIRFEDLHRDSVGIIRNLSEWLGLPNRATLLDSTFNGVPYVVSSGGDTWSGRRLEQVQRRSPSLSFKDRALLFAVFYENFAEWNYPCPKIFEYLIVRCIVFVSLFLFPTKMEYIAAGASFRRWILPLARQGNIIPAVKALIGIGLYRAKIIQLLVPAFCRRCAHRTTLLHVDYQRRGTGAVVMKARGLQETKPSAEDS